MGIINGKWEKNMDFHGFSEWMNHFFLLFSKLPLGRYDNRAATYAFLLGHGAPVLSLQLALQGHLRRKAAAMARMTNK